MSSTESRNPKSVGLDLMNVEEILRLINDEDKKIAYEVEKTIPQIEKLTDRIIEVFLNGGRLFYIGAGTSGRLGVLDASESVPTFSVDPKMVTGLIAGGDYALRNPIENAEDIEEFGREDLENNSFSRKDFCLGIAASGSTPYVLGGLKYAREIGSPTGSISCNLDSLISKYSDYPVEVNTGAEILTGSTRMKAGTATKMVLNMISTTAMIKIGKTYDNYMVDLKPTNKKLINRSIRILKEICNLNEKEAEKYLKDSDFNVKLAIVMAKEGLSKEEGLALLRENGGFIRKELSDE